MRILAPVNPACMFLEPFYSFLSLTSCPLPLTLELFCLELPGSTTNQVPTLNRVLLSQVLFHFLLNSDHVQPSTSCIRVHIPTTKQGLEGLIEFRAVTNEGDVIVVEAHEWIGSHLWVFPAK